MVHAQIGGRAVLPAHRRIGGERAGRILVEVRNVSPAVDLALELLEERRDLALGRLDAVNRILAKAQDQALQHLVGDEDVLPVKQEFEELA